MKNFDRKIEKLCSDLNVPFEGDQLTLFNTFIREVVKESFDLIIPKEENFEFEDCTHDIEQEAEQYGYNWAIRIMTSNLEN
mgnify:CR=1 FL=1